MSGESCHLIFMNYLQHKLEYSTPQLRVVSLSWWCLRVGPSPLYPLFFVRPESVKLKLYCQTEAQINVWIQCSLNFDFSFSQDDSFLLTKKYKIGSWVADEFNERFLHHFRHWKFRTSNVGHWKQRKQETNFANF